jgi:hypothetical protein
LLLLTACSTTPSAEGFMHSALDGAHAVLGCSDCHASELHETIPTTCRGCHVDDAPAEHYPGDCGDCHGEETWGIDGIDHSFFPLVGGHEEPGCIDCHGTDEYDAASEVCTSCHARPDEHYNGACDACHTVYTWEDAAIDHSFFPLTQGHDGPSCTDCHGTDDYEDASSTCSTCHDPPNNHFPGACDDRHNRRDWDDADFNHDPFFPTPHEGVSNCTSCHPGNDYTDFVCTDCHEHRRSEMDDEHEGETNNYVYASWACLDCHPDGDD